MKFESLETLHRAKLTTDTSKNMQVVSQQKLAIPIYSIISVVGPLIKSHKLLHLIMVLFFDTSRWHNLTTPYSRKMVVVKCYCSEIWILGSEHLRPREFHIFQLKIFFFFLTFFPHGLLVMSSNMREENVHFKHISVFQTHIQTNQLI